MKCHGMMIWFPSVLGIVLLLITFLDMYLWDIQTITPKQMATNEITIFCLGLLSLLVVVAIAFYSAVKRHWRNFWLSILNIVMFIICFFVSIYNGVALLYAT